MATPIRHGFPVFLSRFRTSTLVAWLAHPVTSTLEAVCAILAGLAGSLFASDLRAWLAGLLGVDVGGTALEPGRIAGEFGWAGMAFFWALFALTTVLHVGRSVARQVLDESTQRKHQMRHDEVQHRFERSAEEAQARFEKTAAQVSELIATNAAPSYLRGLGMSYEKARYVSQAAETEEDRTWALSHTLQTIAALARSYDARRPRSHKNIYAANVMWYIPQQHAARWDGHVHFRGDGIRLQGVRGVLALAARHSATHEHAPDPRAIDFALDVPVEIGNRQKKWRVLPGAPLAFARQEFEHYHPAKHIAHWLETYGDFPSYVKDKVSRYFERHTEIAGFLSVPLYRPSSKFQQGDREVVGVLNVHWSDADILDHPKTARKFSQTIYPLRVLLAEQMCQVSDRNGPPSPERWKRPRVDETLRLPTRVDMQRGGGRQ